MKRYRHNGNGDFINEIHSFRFANLTLESMTYSEITYVGTTRLDKIRVVFKNKDNSKFAANDSIENHKGDRFTIVIEDKEKPINIREVVINNFIVVDDLLYRVYNVDGNIIDASHKGKNYYYSVAFPSKGMRLI